MMGVRVSIGAVSEIPQTRYGPSSAAKNVWISVKICRGVVCFVTFTEQGFERLRNLKVAFRRFFRKL